MLQLLNDNKELLSDLKCDYSVNLHTLEAVAKIRFILIHLSELLVTQADSDSESKLILLSSVEALCTKSVINTDNTGPRIFLLKALYRKCGETGIQKIANRPSLNWIMPERASDGEVK